MWGDIRQNVQQVQQRKVIIRQGAEERMEAAVVLLNGVLFFFLFLSVSFNVFVYTPVLLQ